MLSLCLLLMLYYGFVYVFYIKKGSLFPKAHSSISASMLIQELQLNQDLSSQIDSVLDEMSNSTSAEIFYALQQALKHASKEEKNARASIEQLIQSKMAGFGMQKLSDHELAMLWSS